MKFGLGIKEMLTELNQIEVLINKLSQFTGYEGAKLKHYTMMVYAYSGVENMTFEDSVNFFLQKINEGKSNEINEIEKRLKLDLLKVDYANTSLDEIVGMIALKN
jgi:hypothetical protein